MANANNSLLKYAKESSLGVNPSTNLTILRRVSEDINYNIDYATSNEIYTDRQLRYSAFTNRGVNLALKAELTFLTLDDLFECAFLNEFNDNSLINGANCRSITIESELSDIATFYNGNGFVVSSISVEIQSNNIINTSVSMIGKNLRYSPTTIGVGSDVQPNTNGIFTSKNVLIYIDGENVNHENTFRSITININNNARQSYALANSESCITSFGFFNCTLSIEKIFKDLYFYDKLYEKESSSILIYVYDESNNAYSFFFPKCFVSSLQTSGTQINTDIVDNVTMGCVVDIDRGYTVELSRIYNDSGPFEYDINGDLQPTSCFDIFNSYLFDDNSENEYMPSNATVTDAFFEIDGSNNIEPI